MESVKNKMPEVNQVVDVWAKAPYGSFRLPWCQWDGKKWHHAYAEGDFAYCAISNYVLADENATVTHYCVVAGP